MFTICAVTNLALGLVLIPLFQVCVCDDEIRTCDRRPLGSKTKPLNADNRFAIEILGLEEKYIPDMHYTVRLYARDNVTSFIGFTISANGDQRENEKNDRKPIELSPGRILSSSDPKVNNTVSSDICPNTVIQYDITPKTWVEAEWIAPPKDHKCVTIYAYVAIKPDVWYNSNGPLSKKVCEDKRNAEDMPPRECSNCRACEEARFELSFEGKWSYNTHQNMFPETRELAKFSDVVGASHSKKFNIYKINSVATAGLKMLAEQGNTTQLEVEILHQIGTNVRTLIKATGPPKPSMTTVTSFRASRQHHYLSLVSAILPSPDWFLGVSFLELCNADTRDWSKNITLNLYPTDAGTDSGLLFEAPNDETAPAQPIALAIINKNEVKTPFAKLKVNLVRTYPTPDCEEENPSSEEKNSGDDFPGYSSSTKSSESFPEPNVPNVPSEEPLPIDPSANDCVTVWEGWLPCEGECIDNKVQGYHSRSRYYINEDNKGDMSQFCKELYPVDEIEECEEDCEEEISEAEDETVPAQRRIWNDPTRPDNN